MWFKVDDDLPVHRKVLAAGNAAMGLWVRAGAWSAREGTLGFIPSETVRTLGTLTQARRLVAAELWRPVKRGFQFHDWETYQPSAEEVEKVRQKRAEAGRKGAQKRWGRDGKPVANAMASGMASDMANQCPGPGPVVSGLGSQSSHGEYAPTDDDLNKIQKATGGTRAHAERVWADVLSRATEAVKRPRAYVLRAIGDEPERYRPTVTALRTDEQCPTHPGYPATNCGGCRADALEKGATA